ncbi:WhiB family transcriptional regulator [Streptomyces sp. NPDC003395]
MSTDTRRRTRPAARDPFWRDHAACAQVDADLFFPLGDNQLARQQAAQAKEICMGCPVRQSCLQWALNSRQDHGVWGGLTAQERHAIHQRSGDSNWARRRNVADDLFANRLEEFTALVEQGLSGAELAEALGTNVQTVNRLLERIAAKAVAEGVAV